MSSLRSAKQQLVHAPGGAAQERPQACQQLLQGERLDQVVVRACIETGNAVADRATSGKHQDRHRVALGAKAPSDLEAVDAGKHDVEHDRIRRRLRHRRERLRAVLGERELVALGLERPHERVADRCFVFDDQETHVSR